MLNYMIAYFFNEFMIKQVKHLKEEGKYAKVITVWYAIKPIPRKYKGDTSMTFSAKNPAVKAGF